MKNITCIKLGGSIITNKEVPMAVRRAVLDRLVDEIARAAQTTGEQYVIGHGQGSFAHAPAMRYRTKEGFVSEDSLIGMAITHDSAAQLNRIVVRAFLEKEIPAITYAMSNTLITAHSKAQSYDQTVFLEYLNQGLFPISGGDVLVDSKQGCSIWSTEQVLAQLIPVMTGAGYQVKNLIHVTEVAGVLDENNQVIQHIDRENEVAVQKMIGKTKGFDVTGGMWHKIDESLALADQGITSYIVSGMVPENVYKILVGETAVCTKICSK